MSDKIKLEVFRSPTGIITVCTDTPTGGGTRLCGIKLPGSSSTLIAEFYLTRNDVQAILDDMGDES